MKLISNFKDYYDWVIGAKFGIDPLVVYERIPGSHGWRGKSEVWKKEGLFRPVHVTIPEHKEPETYHLHVCGTSYIVTHYRGDFYFGKDGLECYDKPVSKALDWLSQGRDQYGMHHHLTDTPLNRKYNCPVLLEHTLSMYRNVRLSDFSLGSILPAEDLYIRLVEFLTYEKPVTDDRTDVERLQSKGFDKKISFRHRK
jgi:hypothetical protein